MQDIKAAEKMKMLWVTLQLSSLLLSIRCLVNDDKIFYEEEKGMKLDLNATQILSTTNERFCLGACLYTDDCHGFNMETVLQDRSYRCHLFEQNDCSYSNFEQYSKVADQNYTFFHTIRSDCQSLALTGQNKSGLYEISPNGELPFEVWCEMTESGSYTLLLRRTNSSLNFTRDWEDYAEGFGNIPDSHWLGNEYLHRITGKCTYEVVVEFKNSSNSKTFATHLDFWIDSEENAYMLHLSEKVESNAQHSPLEGSNGRLFSTYDRPADHSGYTHKTGWWFNESSQSSRTAPTGSSFHQPDITTILMKIIRRGELISEKKPAYQSSNYQTDTVGFNVSASYGNDGKYFDDGKLVHCPTTEQKVNQWWKVDLQNIYLITLIKFYVRPECCFTINNLVNIHTSVKEEDQLTVCRDNLPKPVQLARLETLKCVNLKNGVRSIFACRNKTLARFVQITNNVNTEGVTFCEMQVYGFKMPSDI